MPKVKVFDMAGKDVGELELNDAVFGIEPNVDAMHRAVVAYLANQRQGTQSALTRAEVAGGGRKPWRQKGTGRAVRVRPELFSGPTAASPSLPSPAIIASPSTRR